MKIVPMLQCTSLDGWYPKVIPSQTQEDEHYVVHVNPWANRSEQLVCECKGYQYRGKCSHQKQAYSQHCGWNEVEGPEELTDEQRSSKTCPRCGEACMWSMWEVEEDES